MIRKIIAVVFFVLSMFFVYLSYSYYKIEQQFSMRTIDFLSGSKPEVELPYGIIAFSVFFFILSLILFFIKKNNKATKNKGKYF